MPLPKSKPRTKKVEPSLGDVDRFFPEAEAIPLNRNDLEDLPLGPDVGAKYVPSPTDPVLIQADSEARFRNQPVPTDPLLLPAQKPDIVNLPIQRDRNSLGRNRNKTNYQPIPTDPALLERGTRDTFMQLINGGNVNWWDTVKIQSSLRAIVDLPQVAYVATPEELQGTPEEAIARMFADENVFTVDENGEPVMGLTDRLTGLPTTDLDRESALLLLAHPEDIINMQRSWYTRIVSAPLEPLEGMDVQGSDVDDITNMTASLFKKHEGVLPPELLEYTINQMSLMPDAVKIAEEAGVEIRSGGWWEAKPFKLMPVLGLADPTVGEFFTSFDLFQNAPESIRGIVNDPRTQLTAELNIFLENNDLSTMAGRGKYVEFVNQRVMMSIQDVEVNKSGVGAFLNKTVAVPFILTGNEANDWLYRASGPDQFLSRQNLSIGQNAAIASSFTPDEDAYLTVSGIYDGIANLSPLDPINVVAGIGNGIRMASRTPRIVSRGALVRDLLKPSRLSRFGKLPILDTGPLSRASYIMFSKTHEQILVGRRFQKVARRIAATASEDEIVRIMPSIARSDFMVQYLAELADTPEMVTEMFRTGLRAPELFGTDAPLLAQKTAAGLRSAVDNYVTARQAFLDGGGFLGDLSTIDPIVGVLRRPDVPASLGDAAALRTVLRRSRRYTDSPIVTTVDIKGGRMVIRGSGDTMFGFDADTGEALGGIIKGAGINPTIGTDIPNQRRGVFTAIKNQIPDYGAGRVSLENISGQGEAALGLDNVAVYQRSALTNDGSQKAIVSSVGGGQSVVDLGSDPADLAAFLDNLGFSDEAARALEFAGGAGPLRMSKFSPDAQAAMGDYVKARGGTIGTLGDEVVMSDAGKRSMAWGTDSSSGGIQGLSGQAALNFELQQMMDAKITYNNIMKVTNPKLWLVADTGLNLPTWTTRLRNLTSSKSTSAWMIAARKVGAAMTTTYPTNISLVDTAAGSKQLRNWLKLVGATDDLAEKWVNTYRKGNPGNRWEIVFDAMGEAGEEIKNPMLRDGLIQFGNKQGQQTFFRARDGRELGLVPDGSGRVRPMTISHQTVDFIMPKSNELSQSLRRYKTAKILPNRVSRGYFASTKKTRGELADRIQTKLRKSGVAPKDMPPREDLLAMAYADIVGDDFGRANGFGILSKSVEKLVAKPYRALHNVFVLSQLAGRPIAWSSRVLLEEQFRAQMFGLPTLWSNPYEYGWQLWSTRGIRQLPGLLEDQSRSIDTIVNAIFDNGFSMNRATEIIPDLPRLLDEAGITATDAERVRGFVANTIGKELTGVSEGLLGARSNITSKAVRRKGKIDRTIARMARDGINKEFLWAIDGSDIATRSVFQSFRMEAGSSTHPLEWATSGMSPRMIRDYGYGYGRQMFQQLNDEIIGTYGLHRALAVSTGEATEFTAKKLVQSRSWGKVRHIVDEQLAARGLNLTEVEKAEWYLTNYVDEIVATLFDPLAKGSRLERERILTEFVTSRSASIEMNSRAFVLKAARDNYDGFVRTSQSMAESAYDEGVMLPQTISAYLDPRFGQAEYNGIFGKARQASDWIMERAGERPTQFIHRQPAYKHIHGKNFRYYKAMGWSDEAAQFASAQKAAELVNYIFFDNANIPRFLKSMNQYVPFFSAMWEVGSTWLYKIPSVDTLGVGYLHLGRRVQRVVRGLQQTGIVDYDAETGQMTASFSNEMQNANDPGSAAIGSGIAKLMRAPLTLLEHMGGLANFAMDGFEDYQTADFSAWAKDGFQVAIGNPLDPTSNGIMAVNQFSIGATPALQIPIATSANAIFSLNDEHIISEGKTVAQFMEENQDLDFASLLRFNEQGFRDKNGDEIYLRAASYDWDWDTLEMPDSVKIPQTSLWETLVDRVFFPFGKLNPASGEIIFVASPSAINYAWRGLAQRLLTDDASEYVALFLGQSAASSLDGELLSQLQMREAASGDVSRILDLGAAADRIISDIGFEIKVNDATKARTLLNPEVDDSAANKVRELWDEASKLSEDVFREANNNAAGSQFFRAISGSLGPSTPRMWDREQQQIAAYWAGRNMAETAKETGALEWSKAIGEAKIETPEDMARLANIVDKWIADPSGDQARAWMNEYYPGLRMYTQGKSFWGETGPPVFAEGFDEWIEQTESGVRQIFDPEVYVARYWRAGISTDRDVAIRGKYGTDPDLATQAILTDPEGYRELVDDYNAKYDTVEFLDAHLFDSKYARYRAKKLENLAVFEELESRNRFMQDASQELEDVIRYGNLDPDSRRSAVGYLLSTNAEQRRLFDELRQFENDTDSFKNVREQLLNDYRSQYKADYYESIGSILEGLDTAEDKFQVSEVWEKVRDYSDESFTTPIFLTNGTTNNTFEVPAPEVHSWNSRPKQEKKERILSFLSKRPEWLSKFEVGILSEISPEASTYLPVTDAQRDVYREATRRKEAIRQEWRNDPEAMTKSKRDSLIQEENKIIEETLLEQGRVAEFEYRNAVPLKQLDMLGMIPRSLSGMVPVLNQIITELDMIGKSPTTNEGYRAFAPFKEWLINDYFVQNPTALKDLKDIAWAMYGTKVDSVVMARLLQGERYGEL